MYRLVLYFVATLLTCAVLLSMVGVMPYDPFSIVLQTVVLLGLCWGINRLIAGVLKIPINSESSLITGLILSAIVGPLVLPGDWLLAVVLAVGAIGSKYLVVIRRSHLLNPAAAGAVLAAVFLGSPASWWIGSQALLPVVVIGGVLLMTKIRRWHLVVSFVGVYLGLLAVDAVVIDGRTFFAAIASVRAVGMSASLLFFAFVMLVEPLTAPQTPRGRVFFGAFVGVLLFALQTFVPSVPYSLELALLVGNVASRGFSPSFRQAFVLRRKHIFSNTIGLFWFKPTYPFAFKPGQFLEYTLAHAHPDSRGVRRYFSIASAPTEPLVLLASRFSHNGSTFKQALQQLDEDDRITAAKVAGDFVLPNNAERPLAWIAGGIGITPFRSQLKHLIDTKQTRDIVLVYGVREESDILFRDVLEEAEAKIGLRTVYVVGQSIDAAKLAAEVPDFINRFWYISGPEPMVQGLSQALLSMGVKRRNVKRDYFPGYTT